MCGIFAIINNKSFSLGKDTKQFFNNVDTNKHMMDYRGETSSQLLIDNKVLLYHRRLAINDTSSNGNQPFKSTNGIFSIVNGEIYNYDEILNSGILNDVKYKFKGKSDCEILIPMYMKFGTQFVKNLRGMFSFVIYDSKKGLVLAGRDHIGMTSMYIGEDSNNIYICSDMKPLTNLCDNIKNLEAGHIYINSKSTEGSGIYNYMDLDKWRSENDAISIINTLKKVDNSNINIILEELRNKFISTVESHLKSDVSVGILLSGGLDSSLLASVVSYLKQEGRVGNLKNIKTFTIGVENSVDILAADKVAKYINSEHTAYNFDPEDAITVLEDVIYATETYDITTIRASIPLYLLSTWIKEDTDIKVILSGEVSDEIFAGYSYFKYAPSSAELFLETKDKVKMLQRYDCLRAHKATICNTIELRVPFGDKLFVDYVMNLHPDCKMYGFSLDSEIDSKKIEKYILRKAFEGWLPEDILWRKKEQFSDGVSSEKENVIETLKRHAANEISDDEFNNRETLYPINTPNTKEGLLYYKIFKKMFKHDSCLKTVDHNTKSVACSTERGLKWLGIDENNSKNDPSGHSV